MDGKVLVLCDELPKDYGRYSVKDANYLASDFCEQNDDSQKLFVTWDAIIPEDSEFLDRCAHYARTYEEIPADFAFCKKGKIDPKYGNIGKSIQEDSYLEALESGIAYLRSLAAKGEDIQGMAIDMAFEYPFRAMQRFLEDFSGVLNKHMVATVMPAVKNGTDPEVLRKRLMILEAWQNQDKFMRDAMSGAIVTSLVSYDDFGEVYSKADEEVIKIMSLPLFGRPKR